MNENNLNQLQQDLTGPDRELVLGSIYGIRNWRYYDDPRYGSKLVGQWGGDWQSKGNVAECKCTVYNTIRFFADNDPERSKIREEQAIRQCEQQVYDSYKTITYLTSRVDYQTEYTSHYLDFDTVWSKDFGSGNIFRIRDTSENYLPYETHTQGTVTTTAKVSCDQICQPKCTCGFYAYTAPKNGSPDIFQYSRSWKSHSAISSQADRYLIAGVVRGYGAVTIGTRGFRAEKMDIVALIPNPDVPLQTIYFMQQQYDVPVLPTEAWGESTLIQSYLKSINEEAYVQSVNTWVL